ncbi:hypothetical protein GH714_029090 [Hevea brasiliensis]|uniref:non-specific serine/threonine protein kinase n=1 Tax=Hevea brasiliensis TaxID=3981 RepID=A0A6A6N7U9_HEVBR|nr:hypothetical protein GH714_029090 [Hevea brasiliensis]
MANSISKNFHQIKRLPHLFVIITIFFLNFPFPSAELSFNISSFSLNDPSITYEGDAVANQATKPTGDRVISPTKESIGRATYSKPMKLRDNITGDLTDFTTHFSFSINSKNRTQYADGLFLSPQDSRNPLNATKSALGLTSSVGQELNSANSAFVAVEFEIHKNAWNPSNGLVVIDYMPNLSLEHLLFKEASMLNWEQRHKIVQGLASALHYLHQGSVQCVLHRDIKSSNVLLDSEFNAKLADFGLARIVRHDAMSQTLVGWTSGYEAPECQDNGKSSKSLMSTVLMFWRLRVEEDHW